MSRELLASSASLASGAGPLTTAELLSRLAELSYPTIGHFLEDGFVDPAIQSLLERSLTNEGLDAVKIAGPAVTVRIVDNDAVAMNRALLALTPGSVLVVDMSGDHRHAPVGAVTAAAAKAQGAAGVVVDGVATDLLELRQTALPIFARGTSPLTTKRVYGTGAAVNVPVQCGGITVNPGDLVLADSNGVVVLSREAASAVVDPAAASDAAEPAILTRIASGESLDAILAV
jgi:4-hydroxy-4-methyl-2-oxoglutarate aldolase